MKYFVFSTRRFGHSALPLFFLTDVNSTSREFLTLLPHFKNPFVFLRENLVISNYLHKIFFLWKIQRLLAF